MSLTKYDYAKLRGRLKEKGITQEELANRIHIRETTLSQKLNNKFVFKQQEISDICEVLAIQPADIGVYFFTSKV